VTDKQIIQDCVDIAKLASDTARGFFRQPIGVDFKDDQSPVTMADKTVEAVVRRAISERYPDHGILGEEHGLERAGQDNMWVIDPIDGTRSFITGYPLFGFLLAYLSRGAPDIGIISMPALNEVYMGVRGQGATLNGDSIQVSSVTERGKAAIYINEGDKIFAHEPDVFARLMQAGQTRRLSYDCYPHALLASGHIDAVVDYDLKPYDFLALMPVVEAAGGVITDWHGQVPGLGYEGPLLASATPQLHESLISLLQVDRS